MNCQVLTPDTFTLRFFPAWHLFFADCAGRGAGGGGCQNGLRRGSFNSPSGGL